MDERGTLKALLHEAVASSKGTLPPAERKALLEGGPGPSWAAALISKIRQHAYKVTEEEIAELAAKHGDDAVFEVTIAAAGSAAQLRLDAALAAISEAK